MDLGDDTVLYEDTGIEKGEHTAVALEGLEVELLSLADGVGGIGRVGSAVDDEEVVGEGEMRLAEADRDFSLRRKETSLAWLLS